MTSICETVGQHLQRTLAARGIASRYDGHASANASWIAIELPGGTQVWISDPNASIDHQPAEHTGLMAIHYLSDPHGTPDDAITVYDSIHDPHHHGQHAFQTDLDDLADATAAYLATWRKTPAARHLDRRIDDYGVMDLPARYLRPGDVIIHTASGAQNVVTDLEPIGKGSYRRTTRTITRPLRGSSTHLPDTYWQFPWTLRHSGRQPVTVLAHHHHDPSSLPPIPYPPVPKDFTDGDHIVHDSLIWERTNSTWFNQTRTSTTRPTSDEAILRLFTHNDYLRLGIPAYQPAAH